MLTDEETRLGLEQNWICHRTATTLLLQMKRPRQQLSYTFGGLFSSVQNLVQMLFDEVLINTLSNSKLTSIAIGERVETIIFDFQNGQMDFQWIQMDTLEIPLSTHTLAEESDPGPGPKIHPARNSALSEPWGLLSTGRASHRPLMMMNDDNKDDK